MSLAWLAIALAAGWVGFGYVGYPLLLALLARLSPRPLAAGESAPRLSVIVAVHNGAQSLKRKLEQTLALDYPTPVEIVVASDGSTDGSDEIARSFAERGVLLVRNERRGGKEAAQALGIARASGDVLVFTDVAAELPADALRQIVRPFADPTVGCVSSEDRVDSADGEGAYVRLEMALRRHESLASTLVGLSGSFFAARRALCAPWPAELASDFRTALESARRGLRAVSEPRATASFPTTPDAAAEWRRKVRTVRRGIAVLIAYRELLHPRHGRVALSLWGHKLVRFTSPFALLALLLASAWAAPASPVAAALLAAQLAAYGAGGLSLVVPAVERVAAARLAGFFLLVNASMLIAWAYHLSGRRAVTWEPTKR
jgi:cellulose synthase/poly-beta-1,6-N-acetylglucosamine synthase-like glycosyltransferase